MNYESFSDIRYNLRFTAKPTQRIILWILLNVTNFGLQLHCSDLFGSERISVWVSNQSEMCNYNLNLVQFNKIKSAPVVDGVRTFVCC